MGASRGTECRADPPILFGGVRILKRSSQRMALFPVLTMPRNRWLEVHAGWGAVVTRGAVLAAAEPWQGVMNEFDTGVLVEAAAGASPPIGNSSVEDVLCTGCGAAIAVGWVMQAA